AHRAGFRLHLPLKDLPGKPDLCFLAPPRSDLRSWVLLACSRLQNRTVAEIALLILGALSQDEVTATLTVGQHAVAKLEKRADMHVSNLRRYIEALGGTLEITARFAGSKRGH